MRFDLIGYRIHYNDRNNRRKTSMTKWSWEPGRPALKKSNRLSKVHPKETSGNLPPQLCSTNPPNTYFPT